MTRPTSTIDAFLPQAYADEAGIAARFAEIAARVEAITLAGEPEWVKTNHTGGLKRLSVQIRMKP